MGKTTPRSASVESFEANVQKSSAQSMPDNTIEKRHIEDGEIPSSKLARETIATGVELGPISAITYAITADASSGVTILDAAVPFNMRIVDVVVEATATNASGTVTVSDGTNDITDAIACDTDTAIDRAATIADDYSTLSEGDSIVLTTNGAADRGIVTILIVPVV